MGKVETLPNSFAARPATQADVVGIAALLNARSMDVLGTRAADPARLRVPAEAVVVCIAEAQIVGYAQLSSHGLYLSSSMQGAVQPEFRGRGIGTYLLSWAERQARRWLPQAPEGARVVLHSDNVFSTDYPARDLFVMHGFVPVRQFIHLQTALTEPPPEPVWPEGVRVETVRPDHWPTLGPALEEAFEDHWAVVSDVALAELGIQEEVTEEGKGEREDEDDGPSAEDKLYFNTPGLCFVALAGDDVVGSCLCNAKTVEFPDTGYIGSLSVRRPWRRQGVGLALTYHTLAEFYRRGINHVHTDTDANSFTNAPRLYLKAGFRTFRQEDVYEKELRPGYDLLRQVADPNQ